jgi:hypothetical protein
MADGAFYRGVQALHLRENLVANAVSGVPVGEIGAVCDIGLSKGVQIGFHLCPCDREEGA